MPFFDFSPRFIAISLMLFRHDIISRRRFSPDYADYDGCFAFSIIFADFAIAELPPHCRLFSFHAAYAAARAPRAIRPLILLLPCQAAAAPLISPTPPFFITIAIYFAASLSSFSDAARRHGCHFRHDIFFDACFRRHCRYSGAAIFDSIRYRFRRFCAAALIRRLPPYSMTRRVFEARRQR